MNKLLTIALAGALVCTAFSPAVQASPLKSYNAGNVAISAGLNAPTSLNFTEHANYGKKGSFYAGATAGLGHNLGLNYKYNQYKTSEDPSETANQVNLMYKVLPWLDIYGGYVNAKTDVNGSSHTSNSGQVGLQARYDIPLLFTVWGNVGVGNKLNSYEFGVSKALLNNLELDLSYYDSRFKDIEQGGDMKAHGLNLGLTVKF